MMDEFIARMAASGAAWAFMPVVVFLVFLLHEAGHYTAARVFGVRVLSFTIGLGPKLRQWTDSRGTVWAVHLFPLCGMVHLAGQEERSDNHAAHDKFNARPVWQRAIIVAAGPAVNLLLALVLIGGFYLAAGVPAARTEVPGVEVGSPADRAGIEPGDVIEEINGRPVRRFAQVRVALNDHVGKPMVLTVSRNGERRTVSVTPEQADYKTREGFARSHARMGVLTPERAMALHVVRRVNDTDTKDAPDKAIAALRAANNGVVTVGLHSVDESIRVYRARVSMEAVERAEKTKMFQFGTWPPVFYDHPGIGESAGAAMADTGRLIRGTLNIAAQMFPADAALFRPDIRPLREEGAVRHDVFILLYIGALWSVFTAFFNLLPIARLDGGVLLMLGLEALCGAERAKAASPYVMRTAFLLFLGALAFMNAGDFMTVMNIQ